MNFGGTVVDNFIMLRLLHPQELIFGRSTLRKRTSWLPKLVIYLPVQSRFRDSEVLCKIASHTVHCHDAEAAILKNLQWKTGKGTEANRVEWEFTNGAAIFRSFRLEREKRNTSEDFRLFRKVSGGVSCTIWIANRNFRCLLTNGKRPMVNAHGHVVGSRPANEKEGKNISHDNCFWSVWRRDISQSHLTWLCLSWKANTGCNKLIIDLVSIF